MHECNVYLNYIMLQIALLIILLQDQWKKAKETNAKKAKDLPRTQKKLMTKPKELIINYHPSSSIII